jgi:hypothetical protein
MTKHDAVICFIDVSIPYWRDSLKMIQAKNRWKNIMGYFAQKSELAFLDKGRLVFS